MLSKEVLLKRKYGHKERVEGELPRYCSFFGYTEKRAGSEKPQLMSANLVNKSSCERLKSSCSSFEV